MLAAADGLDPITWKRRDFRLDKAMRKLVTVRKFCSAFTEIVEEMMQLAHDHDGFMTEDCLQIRATEFARQLGVSKAG
jgi:hypothetical protein